MDDQSIEVENAPLKSVKQRELWATLYYGGEVHGR